MASPFAFAVSDNDEPNDVLLAVDEDAPLLPDTDDTLQLALAFVDEFQLSASTSDSAGAAATTVATPPPPLQPQQQPSPEQVSQQLLAQVLDVDVDHQHTVNGEAASRVAYPAFVETDTNSLVEQVLIETGVAELLQSTAIGTNTYWLAGQDTQQQQQSADPGILAPIESNESMSSKKSKKQQTQLTKGNGGSRRPTTTRHASNKARDERKEELIYLRKKVSELEQQLIKNRQRFRLISSPSDPAGRISMTRDSETYSNSSAKTSVWQEIVSRQYTQRVKAERENIRLKLVLENQIKIAKSLEKVLQKTTSTNDFENLIRGMKPSFSLYCLPPQATDFSGARRLFEELLSGMDDSYAEAEAIFLANGVARMETSSIDAVIRSDGSVGIELEVFGNKVLPFDMRAAGSVVWHHYAFAKDRIPNRVYHHNSPQTLNATEDTILEDFNLELDVNSATALFHAKSVMRRYMEENRIVIVWRAFFDPLHIADKPTLGVRFLERGYIVIKKTHTAAGAVNNVLQTCYISTPVTTGDLEGANSTILRTIIDFMLSTTAANISSSHEMIENVLLEHAIKAQYVK